MIADAKCLIDKIKEKGVISFADMSNVSYLNISEAQKMQENFKKGRDYLWRNQAELKKGVDYISQYAEYKNDKLAQKRFEYGLALVGVAVLGITLVISTAGAGAPLVFTGIAGACDVGLVCEGVQDTYYGAIKDIETPSINPVRDYAGATYIGADSTAKTIEGIQEIYYGLNNDFETPSFNGVRDGIFRGNQKYYDTANLIIYSCFQCTGSYKNIYTAGSKALENGASAELAKITASGEEMFKAGVGSLADFTGEKLAKSCSDDMLAQFVIQTTFSFGVQKGTDKAAKSFGVGFSNKMSKYVGKAGTTSTISGPKIGDANIDMPETFKVKEPEVHSESPMFGEDWNSFFREKYGEGNVTWESAPYSLNEFDTFDANYATNIQKGNFGEYESHYNLTQNKSLKDAGYDLKSIGKDAPRSLNDKIEKGIDGLYVNNNPDSNIRYVIDEAKFGQSNLSKTRDRRQMSDNWLKGKKTKNDRIFKVVKNDKFLADDIKKALVNNQVERVLSRVDADGKVTTYKLDKDGKVIGTWP